MGIDKSKNPDPKNVFVLMAAVFSPPSPSWPRFSPWCDSTEIWAQRGPFETTRATFWPSGGRRQLSVEPEKQKRYSKAIGH